MVTLNYNHPIAIYILLVFSNTDVKEIHIPNLAEKLKPFYFSDISSCVLTEH